MPLLAIALLVLFASPSSAQEEQKNLAEFDRLAAKAAREGPVGVIVRLDVPRIEELTAASVSATGLEADQAAGDRLVAGDAALKAAIDTAADKVILELAATDFAVNTRYLSVPYLALRVSADALDALAVSPAVSGIEEDLPNAVIDPVEDSHPVQAADVPFLDSSANLIGATTAWNSGYTGSGWYVAVLDSGIRRTHQFFSGKTIVEACFALGADGVGGAGDCPNGNATQTGPGSAAHYASTYNGFDHGTHVSGIATGSFGSLGGIAKGANIVAVQVFSKTSDGEILGWGSDTLRALDYVYSIRGSYRIASVNMSLGGSARYSSACDLDSRKSAIDNLRAAGIATAIATGNDSSCIGISAPACISTSVAVGSSTKSDGESAFNNWHPTMQRLFAPGSAIYSSTGASNSSYASWNGTSMATPHVAGAWALMKQLVPNGSVTDLLAALRNTGVAITSVCNSRATSIPRLRVDRALASLASFQLVIQSTQYGTTDPAPGTYRYTPNTQVSITARPDTYAVFTNWSGSATGSANPLTVTMDADKTITANFRYIFPPVASGRKVLNRSFSQAEHIDVLSWQGNAANAGLNIARYRIYRVSGGTATLLTEVTANQASYEYQRRNAGQDVTTYLIAAVTDSGREGEPATVTAR